MYVIVQLSNEQRLSLTKESGFFSTGEEARTPTASLPHGPEPCGAEGKQLDTIQNGDGSTFS